MEYNDQEMLMLVAESNEGATNMMIEKYNYIIDIIINKYQKMAITLNVERNDLYQEGLIGLVEALRTYKDDKQAGLNTFINLCVERKIVSALIKANRIKNRIVSDSVSLEHQYDEYKQPLMYFLSDNNQNNPLESIMKDEDLHELMNQIKECLSDKEFEVYSLMINGLTYQEISVLLELTPKQVDNSMQRIKAKVRKLIDDKKE